MNVLITGGLGCIGSQFAATMLRAGRDVVIIDSAEQKRQEWVWQQLHQEFGQRVRLYRERLEYLLPVTDLSSMLADTSFVLHAAASTGIPYSAECPTDDWDRNVEGTRVLLNALRRTPRPTVMLSSVKPYDISSLQLHEESTHYQLAAGRGVNETFPLDPDEPYAASKAAQSMMSLAYARSYDLPITILRCSNLYGPAPCHGPRHGWLTWFCIAAVLGRPIEIQGSGKQTRDLLFIDDVTTAVFAAKSHLDQTRGQVYNVGGGPLQTLSVLDAIVLLEQLLERPVATVHAEGRRHEDLLFVTDTSKFLAATGWVSKVDVRQGVSRVLEWAKQHQKTLGEIYF